MFEQVFETAHYRTSFRMSTTRQKKLDTVSPGVFCSSCRNRDTERKKDEMEIEIKGRTLDIDIYWASQGHRARVMEWDGDNWHTLPNWDGVLCILQTEFETLASISSDLFDEAVFAEDMAQRMGIDMRFYDEDEEGN